MQFIQQQQQQQHPPLQQPQSQTQITQQPITNITTTTSTTQNSITSQNNSNISSNNINNNSITLQQQLQLQQDQLYQIQLKRKEEFNEALNTCFSLIETSHQDYRIVKVGVQSIVELTTSPFCTNSIKIKILNLLLDMINNPLLYSKTVIRYSIRGIGIIGCQDESLVTPSIKFLAKILEFKSENYHYMKKVCFHSLSRIGRRFPIYQTLLIAIFEKYFMLQSSTIDVICSILLAFARLSQTNSQIRAKCMKRWLELIESPISQSKSAGILSLGYASCPTGNIVNDKNIESLCYSKSIELLQFHKVYEVIEDEQNDPWKMENVYQVQISACKAMGLLARSNTTEWLPKISKIFKTILSSARYAGPVKAQVLLNYGQISYYLSSSSPFFTPLKVLLFELSADDNSLISAPSCQSLTKFALSHDSNYSEVKQILRSKIPNIKNAKQEQIEMFLKTWCKLIAKNYRPILNQCSSIISSLNSDLYDPKSPLSNQLTLFKNRPTTDPIQINPSNLHMFDNAFNDYQQLVSICRCFSTIVIHAILALFKKSSLVDHIQYKKALKEKIIQQKLKGFTCLVPENYDEICKELSNDPFKREVFLSLLNNPDQLVDNQSFNQKLKQYHQKLNPNLNITKDNSINKPVDPRLEKKNIFKPLPLINNSSSNNNTNLDALKTSDSSATVSSPPTTPVKNKVLKPLPKIEASPISAMLAATTPTDENSSNNNKSVEKRKSLFSPLPLITPPKPSALISTNTNIVSSNTTSPSPPSTSQSTVNVNNSNNNNSNNISSNISNDSTLSPASEINNENSNNNINNNNGYNSDSNNDNGNNNNNNSNIDTTTTISEQSNNIQLPANTETSITTPISTPTPPISTPTPPITTPPTSTPTPPITVATSTSTTSKKNLFSPLPLINNPSSPSPSPPTLNNTETTTNITQTSSSIAISSTTTALPVSTIATAKKSLFSPLPLINNETAVTPKSNESSPTIATTAISQPPPPSTVKKTPLKSLPLISPSTIPSNQPLKKPNVEIYQLPPTIKKTTSSTTSKNLSLGVKLMGNLTQPVKKPSPFKPLPLISQTTTTASNTTPPTPTTLLTNDIIVQKEESNKMESNETTIQQQQINESNYNGNKEELISESEDESNYEDESSNEDYEDDDSSSTNEDDENEDELMIDDGTSGCNNLNIDQQSDNALLLFKRKSNTLLIDSDDENNLIPQQQQQQQHQPLENKESDKSKEKKKNKKKKQKQKKKEKKQQQKQNQKQKPKPKRERERDSDNVEKKEKKLKTGNNSNSTIGAVSVESAKLYQDIDFSKKSQSKDPIICSFYKIGMCKKGTECTFLHEGPVELRKPTELCKFFKSGACARGAACTFSHDLAMEACKFYNSPTGCTNSECPYGHRLVTPPLNPTSPAQLSSPTLSNTNLLDQSLEQQQQQSIPKNSFGFQMMDNQHFYHQQNNSPPQQLQQQQNNQYQLYHNNTHQSTQILSTNSPQLPQLPQ